MNYPEYQSHKRVRAVKLQGVEGLETEEVRFFPEDSAIPPIVRPISSEVAKRCKPVGGDPGYFVVYVDGFESWSPTVAFEEGYTLV